MGRHRRELIYDEKLNPLMSEIIAICKAEHIPFLAAFQIDEDDFFCTTIIARKEEEPYNRRLLRAHDVLQSGTGLLAFTISRGEPR